MLRRIKRALRIGGVDPREGNTIVINSEKLERRVALLESGVLEEYEVVRYPVDHPFSREELRDDLEGPSTRGELDLEGQLPRPAGREVKCLVSQDDVALWGTGPQGDT